MEKAHRNQTGVPFPYKPLPNFLVPGAWRPVLVKLLPSFWYQAPGAWLRCNPTLRLRVFDIRIKPRQPPRPQVEVRRVRRVAVVLVVVQVKRSRLAESLERVEHANGADWRGADVLILVGVIHQQRARYLVRPIERRHVEIRVLCLEEAPPFTLESERRERPVVHAVARDTRLEVGHERQRVHRAERAVAVAADAHLVAIDVAGVHHGIDDEVEMFAQVARVVVVHLARVAHDRQIGFDERVALRHPDLHRRRWPRRRNLRKAVDVRAVLRLIVLRLRRVLARIEPNDARKLRARPPVFRQRDVDPELDAIARTRDLKTLQLRPGDFRTDVFVVRDLRARVRLRVANEGIGDHRRRLVCVDELRIVVVERGDELLVRVGRTVEHPRALARLEVEYFDPRTRRLRIPPRARRTCAGDEHCLVVAADDDDGLVVRAALHRQRAAADRISATGTATTTAAATTESTKTAATGQRNSSAEAVFL